MTRSGRFPVTWAIFVAAFAAGVMAYFGMQAIDSSADASPRIELRVPAQCTAALINANQQALLERYNEILLTREIRAVRAGRSMDLMGQFASLDNQPFVKAQRACRVNP